MFTSFHFFRLDEMFFTVWNRELPHQILLCIIRVKLNILIINKNSEEEQAAFALVGDVGLPPHLILINTRKRS